jgi:AcrR family transcriptional regulator
MARPERERQILAAAHARFASRGYAAVTMEEVADAVGVTKPLLYAYFGNKERLYLACLARAWEALNTALQEPLSGSCSDPAAALRGALRAFFAFLEDHRDRWRLLYDETLPGSGEVAERVAHYRERLASGQARLIARLADPDVVQPPPAAEALAHALLGAAEALARWWLRTEALPAGEAAELLIATIEPGIRGAIAAVAPAERLP